MENTTEDLINTLMREKYEPIAVVGIGLRFPRDITDTNSFAKMLTNGEEGISPIPENRWNNKKYYHPVRGTAGKICTHSGGYVNHFDLFDPAFFSISPKEASNMDPQQRLILEIAWEALENANINPETLIGSNGSVFIGASTIDYHKETLGLNEEELVNQMGTGTANSAISGRISYFLGMRGPCLTLDTACSSSLVALHLSMQALRQKESDIALCGAVSLIHHPLSHIVFSHANMLAQDGRCKTFDQTADGYGRSEGAGLVVLKRLSDALKDNNPILALLRGSSVLQDGQSGGLTVPNGLAQEQVMRKALENALLEPQDIHYVEAHGTGTPLGDPIEMQAINQVFGDHFNQENPLFVGSVKTNVGHMEAAAGMGGLIKVILQIKNSQIYPHLNLTKPSEHIPWQTYPIHIPLETKTWESHKKRALINSFGFTGTIASVVVEEPLPRKVNESKRIPTNIVTISAKNIASLKDQIRQYLTKAHTLEDSAVSSFCYTTNIGRAHFLYRVASLVKNKASLIEFLEKSEAKLQHGDLNPNRYAEHKIAFLFTGQGAQYVGMGKSLYTHYPLFKEKVDTCDALFFPYLKRSIKAIILGDDLQSNELIDETQYSQPALFTLEYALSQLWSAWGIKPSIVIGHSIGEVVAATVAGIFTLEDAIKLVANRAKLMQSVQKVGGMLAVQASAATLEPYLKASTALSFAAINAPEQCVLSGDINAIDSLANLLAQQNIPSKKLKVSHAFHSFHMEEILDAFSAITQTIHYHEPSLPIISNVTGELAKNEMLTPEYWVQHIRKPVNFWQGMTQIEKRGSTIFLEIGPNPILTALGKHCISDANTLWFPSMKSTEENEILQSLVGLYKAGFKIHWQNVHPNAATQMQIPFYPFQRKRYWLSNAKIAAKGTHHTLLGEKTVAENGVWEYQGEASPDNPSYLRDHVVMGKIVFPGAAFVDMILALQDAVFGKTGILIENFQIHLPLFLQNDTSTALLTRLEKRNETQYDFEINSLNQETQTKHITGTLTKTDITPLLSLFKDFPSSSPSNTESQNEEAVYSTLFNKGLEYGPAFRKVILVEKYSDIHVKGQIAAYESPSFTFLPPPVLDAVLHTIDAALHAIHPNKTYLPVGYEKFVFLKKPKNTLVSKIHLKELNDKGAYHASADLLLLDDDEPVFIAQNLLLKTITGAVHKKAQSEKALLYTPKWLKLPLNENLSSKTTALLFIGDAISAVVKNYLNTVTSLTVINDASQVNISLKCNAEINQFIYFWQNTAKDDSLESLQKEAEINYQFILRLINLLEKEYISRNMKLLFVTKGGQIKAQDNPHLVKGNHLLQSTLWGFCTVLNNEHPKYESKVIDFDPLAEWTLLNYKQLIQEIFNTSTMGEFQIAYRKGKRFGKRLCATTFNKDNFKLEINDFGTFSNIVKSPIPLHDPKGDEILVKVYAAGLNFKDVLNALGLLKNYGEMPLGFECAGIVIASGESASFSPGDAVIVSHLGCMQKFITVSSQMAVRKPKNITFEEGAALATAYITSYHALHHLSHIKAGDKVLIHAGAGGVGQAAIQLAKRAKAEIFVTASEGKWDFLKKQDIQHIMNSRDLSFGDIIFDKTAKKGVDIILNSLNKEYIPMGLKSLATNGRFVEIGKLDVWDHQQVKDLRPDVEYHHFDLSELPSNELITLNKNILETIVDCLEKGEIAPLPVTVFGLDEVQEAFATLSRGANLGKLVISFMEEESYISKPFSIKENRTYVITGGFGALGLLTAKWLANQGARNIALFGRHLPKPAQLKEIAKDFNQNINLIPMPVDIANALEVKEAFTKLQQHPPIGGIIHGAGIIQDGPLYALTWENLDKVFSAKIYGTWVLHQEAKALKDLDFLIGYSSIASLVGSSGQANYAAANAYIDMLMTWRRLTCQPGLAINWGPWAEVGMAANLSTSFIQSIEEKGMKFIKPQAALQALSQAAASNLSQCVIGEFNWSKYHNSLPTDNRFYNEVASKGEKTITSSQQTIDILSLPSEERLHYIHTLIREKLAIILHYDDKNEIESNAKFSDLGLDSLVSVEFKNVLEKTFTISLPVTIIFDYPSIPLLAEYLLIQFNGDTKKKKGGFSKLIDKFKEHI